MRPFDDDLRDDPELGPTARRLESERPAPSPDFRAALLERLTARRPERRGRSRVGALITAYAGAGLLLLTVAAVGLVGVGPFAA